jgi:hypothetical protein
MPKWLRDPSAFLRLVAVAAMHCDFLACFRVESTGSAPPVMALIRSRESRRIARPSLWPLAIL